MSCALAGVVVIGFGDDVAAGVQRTDDVLVVGGVHRGGDHGGPLRLTDHPLEVGVGEAEQLGRAGVGGPLLRKGDAAGVDVADGDQSPCVL
jgi:hypothetical protein